MLMKLNNIFKSEKLLVILSAILYSIPYINFDLYILHWFFLLPILYLIEFKNTNIIFTGLLFGVTSSFIGQYWITETLMNIAGVSFSNGILIHTIYSLYESIFSSEAVPSTISTTSLKKVVTPNDKTAFVVSSS